MELRKNGIYDKSVLNVIEDVDRSLFVDENLKQKSNLNIALPIDCGQTISQPLVVAYMTQSLNLNNKLRVLEIGTGSGYQSYILSNYLDLFIQLKDIVLLKKNAEILLKSLGVKNVFKHADGGLGWNEQAPFDRIIVTANAPEIPNILVEQLVNDGVMIIPVGDDYNQQILKKVVKKKKNKILVENIMQVRFVPLIEGKSNK